MNCLSSERTVGSVGSGGLQGRSEGLGVRDLGSLPPLPESPAGGVGIDTVDLKRWRNVLARSPQMVRRIASASEIYAARSSTRPAEVLAGVFAAKEAALKSLGVGLGALRMDRIEVSGWHWIDGSRFASWQLLNSPDVESTLWASLWLREASACAVVVACASRVGNHHQQIETPMR